MRSNGILMPISSLPSPYGIGTFGRSAYEFVDFLHKAGQTYWQLLPICPTSYGDSPYQSFSAFAGNPYFIDLNFLVIDGFLYQNEIDGLNFGDNPERIDYGALYNKRFDILRLAASRLSDKNEDFLYFKACNISWLEDYALFMAIKDKNGGISFSEWRDAERLRDTQTMETLRSELKDDIHFWCAVQYLFYFQWNNLKRYANENNIKIIGDMPIYVSADSADIWAHPEMFEVDENGNMSNVAGCPPDAFSSTGQLWGNPLYDWDFHRESGYEWWIGRLRHATAIYDIVRIDHFRGFAGFYSIPSDSETAVNGEWRKGPGISLIDAVKKAIPEAKIIAEDLGFLTPDVYDLLNDSGFPGMKVLQFAFDSREESDYLPHNYEKNSVCYTGTHDNSTTEGWKSIAPEEDVKFAAEYLGISDYNDMTYAFIRAAMSSVSDTTIEPIQDWLMLDDSARINTPSTLGGNWVWRAKQDAFTDELAEKMYRYTKIYGRLTY